MQKTGKIVAGFVHTIIIYLAKLNFILFLHKDPYGTLCYAICAYTYLFNAKCAQLDPAGH